MTVNVLAFVEAMTKRWPQPTNNALKESWAQQAQTFNEHISGNNSHPWSVLHPPTGTGKSQGLALYCSMLSATSHPGVLVVVRMKEEANELAKTINDLAGSDVALALHSDNEPDTDSIYNSPVLIVTHSGYEHAMLSPSKWDLFLTYQNGKRKLTVIDESLSIIKHDQVHLDELRQLKGHIPYDVLSSHPLEEKALDAVIQTIEVLTRAECSLLLSAEDLGTASSATFDGLRKALKRLPLDSLVLHAIAPEERSRMVARHIETLTRLETIIEDWSLYASKGTLHTLTTGKVIIPRELMNAVVLDATARFDPIYELLGETVRLIEPPQDIRNYSNVTLHVSTGHKAGKHSLAKSPGKDAAAFMADLSQHVSINDKLLVCTHKVSKPHLEGYGEHISVAHWGAIDGKNDWRDCNKIALFGLSYLDRILPEVSLIAMQHWTGQSLSKTQYEQTTDKLYWGHVAVTIIQAINRVRCRIMIDEQGHCSPTDVYVLLPAIKNAKNFTHYIAQAMPGIKPMAWVSHAAKKRLRRSDYEAPLVSHLSSLGRGKHLTKVVRDYLGIPQRAFERLIAKAKDETSLLHTELQRIGFSYVKEGIGRGARSWFVMN